MEDLKSNNFFKNLYKIYKLNKNIKLFKYIKLNFNNLLIKKR